MNFMNKEKIDLGNSLLRKVKQNNELSKHEYKLILEIAYNLLTSEEESYYNMGLSIICHVAESKPEDAFIHQLLFDCIIESRVFLYHEMYQKIDEKYLKSISYGTLDQFAKSFYTLRTGTVLTRDQKRLFEDFQKYKRLVVSAPTSFGKSRIISEIIMQASYNNIAIILPTIALLNETYLTLRKNPIIKEQYNIINTLTQEFGENKNIFILTPEKMDLLLDSYTNLKIDFFSMDEIYKIQDDEGRKQVFTHCLYRLTKMNCDFYLIGPYFKNFSKIFLKRNKAIFRRYSAEIVQKDTIDISNLENKKEFIISNQKFKKLVDNDRNLINILKSIDGQTLVYLKRKDSVENKAKKIAQQQSSIYIKNDLIDYIKLTISEDWSLVNCLEKGVAFHHGSIPKYIQTEIVDAFNNQSIKTLICTTTLTEGVNTSAKNIIIYHNKKGKEFLSGFDVKNIKGRAGRFMSHFIGRVIVFEKLNNEEEKDTIEFSYYDNKLLSSEEIIQVNKEDLYDGNLIKRNETERLLGEMKIPLEIIQKNKFIKIENQYSLIQYLRENYSKMQELLFTSQYPNNKQLDDIMQICYTHLFSEKDKENKNFWLSELCRLTKFYIYHSPSIKELIEQQDGKTIDTKIRKTFSLISNYFEFSLPKYFLAFENLFNFVFKERFSVSNAINLKVLIMKLEFGSLSKHEIILKEAGIPSGIINKISKQLSDCDTVYKIKAKLLFDPTIKNVLSDYEKSIFNKYI